MPRDKQEPALMAQAPAAPPLRLTRGSAASLGEACWANSLAR